MIPVVLFLTGLWVAVIAVIYSYVVRVDGAVVVLLVVFVLLMLAAARASRRAS